MTILESLACLLFFILVVLAKTTCPQRNWLGEILQKKIVVRMLLDMMQCFYQEVSLIKGKSLECFFSA